MSVRAKSIIVGVLLALALGLTAFFAVKTIQAFKEYQQQHALVTAGDVRSIRSWMTIPYIAHTYQVPESYLYQSLRITDTQPSRHATLHALALRYKRSVNDLVHTLQGAIQDYRKYHPYKHKAYQLVTNRHMPDGTTCDFATPQIKGHPLVERMCR